MISLRLAGSLGLLSLAGTRPTFAQSAGSSEQSMFTLIRDGIEWPAWFILAGSVVVLAIIAEHFLTIRRKTIIPIDQVKRAKDQIERRNFRECLNRMQKSSTFFARVMTAALQHGRHGFDAMHEAALEKSGELSGRMFRKVEYLNIFGNLGPLMGLLGTVWGMIIAFGAMGAGGGTASAENLSRGISLALVNTMLGLMLAVVGLGFFGICRNRTDSLTVHATVQVLDLLEYFRPSAAAPRTEESRKPPRSVPPPPAAQPAKK